MVQLLFNIFNEKSVFNKADERAASLTQVLTAAATAEVSFRF